MVIVKPVIIPPEMMAVAVAGVELAPENVTDGAAVKPLPPPTRFIAVTTPPVIVAVAEAFGVVTTIEPVPVADPIVFPVMVDFPDPVAKYIASHGLDWVLV